MCAKWSPKDENIFATLSNAGEICLYNIEKDDIPISKVDISKGEKCLYNKFEWNDEGTIIAVGDLKGSIQIIEIIYK